MRNGFEHQRAYLIEAMDGKRPLPKSEGGMSPADRAIVDAFRKQVDLLRVSDIVRIVVYGSRARGTGDGDSDLDILVLVREKRKQVERALGDAAFRVMWDFNFDPVISLQVMDEAEFRRGLELGFSFYRNVREEGVTV